MASFARTWIATVLGLSLLSATPTPLSAHGEHNLEPFVRMRGLAFFNVSFSHDRLKVNETMTISGKFRMMESWPRILPEPELSWIGILVPGPKLATKERWINGRFIQNAFHIEIGRLYDFRLVLQARQPGRYHVHPMINLAGTGGLVGPAKWVEVEPGDSPPSYRVTLSATGETIDLEHFGFGRIVGWHLVFGLLGVAWLVYWATKPLLVRHMLLLEGVDEEQFSRRDRTVAGVFGAVLAAVLIGGLWITNANMPPTIPHQTPREWNLPDSQPLPQAVRTTIKEMRYQPTSRALRVQVEVTNLAESPVLLRKFTTSYLSFVNRDSLGAYPDPEGTALLMDVQPSGLIQPGQTSELTLSMQDSVWDRDRFIAFDQPQLSAAGTLIFVEPQPPAGQTLPLIMHSNDREAPGVPWELVRSANEVYANLQVDFTP